MTFDKDEYIETVNIPTIYQLHKDKEISASANSRQIKSNKSNFSPLSVTTPLGIRQ